MISHTLQKGRIFNDIRYDRPAQITTSQLAVAQAVQDYLTQTQSQSVVTINAVDEAIDAAIVCILLPFRVHSHSMHLNIQSTNGYPPRSGNTVSAGWDKFLSQFSAALSNPVADTSSSSSATSEAPLAAATNPVFSVSQRLFSGKEGYRREIQVSVSDMDDMPVQCEEIYCRSLSSHVRSSAFLATMNLVVYQYFSHILLQI